VSEQSHRSDPRILNRRTLEKDHRRLADLLRPGMSVLDVGCGTGAITAGIAPAVGPTGKVVGVDRDESLLEIAKQDHKGIRNIRFETADALSLPFERCFDVVTAARTLQWISHPDRALARMSQAARSKGYVVVLDYNHEHNSWEPVAPKEFERFYLAFLTWRAANNWDNRIAHRLPDLFRSAGLAEVHTFIDDETVHRGHPDFPDATAIWTRVIQTLGSQIVSAGFLHERDRIEAESAYQPWARTRLQRQSLSMRTVVGRVP
jgi:SAM-dependent methyltransferase